MRGAKRPIGARFEREELSYSLPKDEMNLGLISSLSDQICAAETASTAKQDSPAERNDLEAILAMEEEEELEDSSVEYITTVKQQEVGPPRAKRLRTNDYESGRLPGQVNYLPGSLISQLRDQYLAQKRTFEQGKRLKSLL